MRFNIATGAAYRYLPLQLVRSGHAGSAAFELAVSSALLTRVAAREVPATLRLYRPGPTVAFGKLDTLRPGCATAQLGRTVARLRARAAAPGRSRRRLSRGSRWGSTSSTRSTIPSPGTHDRCGSEGERLAGALGDARRRRARGGGARRVLPGRLQRRRARAREADRHRATAGPRRGTARRLDRGRRRRRRPRRAARRLRRARTGVGQPSTPALSTRRSPGVTVSARRGGRHRGLLPGRAGGARPRNAGSRRPRLDRADLPPLFALGFARASCAWSCAVDLSSDACSPAALLRRLGGVLRDLLAALERLLAGLLRARSLTSWAIGPSFSSSTRVDRDQHPGEEADSDRADGQAERVLLGDALRAPGLVLDVPGCPASRRRPGP